MLPNPGGSTQKKLTSHSGKAHCKLSWSVGNLPCDHSETQAPSICGSVLPYVPYTWGKMVLGARPVALTRYIHPLCIGYNSATWPHLITMEARKCSSAVHIRGKGVSWTRCSFSATNICCTLEHSESLVLSDPRDRELWFIDTENTVSCYQMSIF